MIVADGNFLLEDTEDNADVVNNICSHAREQGKVVLFCRMDGILNEQDQTKTAPALDYFYQILEEPLKEILIDNKCAIMYFANPLDAQQYAETYFYRKNDILDTPEKYVYNCIAAPDGSVHYENITSSRSEGAPLKVTDIYTEEELLAYETALQLFRNR